MKLGKRLKKLRKERKETQEQVAKEIGIVMRHYQRIELLGRTDVREMLPPSEEAPEEI